MPTSPRHSYLPRLPADRFLRRQPPHQQPKVESSPAETPASNLHTADQHPSHPNSPEWALCSSPHSTPDSTANGTDPQTRPATSRRTSHGNSKGLYHRRDDVPTWTQLFTFSYESSFLPPRQKGQTDQHHQEQSPPWRQRPPTNQNLQRTTSKVRPIETLQSSGMETAVGRHQRSRAPAGFGGRSSTANSRRERDLEDQAPDRQRRLPLSNSPGGRRPNSSNRHDNGSAAGNHYISPRTAGGLDGLCSQDLQDMVSASAGGAATRLLESLAALLTPMLRGEVSLEACSLLCGASLTELRKPDGGIRLIAVGNVPRRLAGEIVSHRVMEEMGTLVRPAQLGYGTRWGCEAAVHATRAFLEEEEETQVLLKMDFRNAFNTIHRDAMLHAVRTHLTDYFRFIWQMYRFPTQLSFGEFVLHSAAGVEQWDPLAPLLFCLVKRKLTRTMTSPINV